MRAFVSIDPWADLQFAKRQVEAECLAEVCPAAPPAPPKGTTSSPITAAIETLAARAISASTSLYRQPLNDSDKALEAAAEAAVATRDFVAAGVPAGGGGVGGGLAPGAGTPLNMRSRSMWNTLVNMGTGMSAPPSQPVRAWVQSP